jgi:hypothetical protein
MVVVVSVRTQKDLAFAATLRALGEERLSNAWANTCDALTRASVLVDGRWTGAEVPDALMRELEAVLGDELWSLDSQLVTALEAR